jgi:hypothetical protein
MPPRSPTTLLLTAPTLLLAATAHGAPRVNIQLDDATLQARGIDGDELRSTMADQIESTFQLEADPSLMEKLARANAHAVRGLGVDYASNPELFVFGLSVGTAVNQSGFDLFDRDSSLLPSNGFTAQAGVMAGMNLGAFTPGTDTLLDRFVVSTNAMRAAPAVADFKATVWTWGLHGQYAVMMPVGKGALTWGGLDLTTGFDLASYTVALDKGYPLDGGYGTWNAVGTYELKARATTIPVEISTSASVPGVSLWLGLAGDLAPGARATREVSLRGDITDDEQPGTVLGSVTAKLQEDVRVQPIGGRFFTGLQFDIFAVKLYSQLNISTDRSVGMHAGIRAAL